MAAICWYFNQLGGNSTCNKEESLLSVLQFLPQASAVRAYRKFSFMASAIDKLCRPHQTSLMIPRISSTRTGMVQTPTLPFKRISFQFIIYYTPVYFQYIHLSTGNTATKLMVLWWATAVRLVVCKFIERNTKHQIPCVCIHDWLLKLILIDIVVAIALEEVVPAKKRQILVLNPK